MTREALAKRVVETMLADDAFSRWMGVEVVELAPGRCTLTMTVRDDMMNGFNVCHGGVTYSLADSAFAFASNSHGRLSLALDTNITYPARVVSGDVLTAEAEEVSLSNRVGTYRVRVSNHESVVVGEFRGTVYRTGRHFFPDETQT